MIKIDFEEKVEKQNESYKRIWINGSYPFCSQRLDEDKYIFAKIDSLDRLVVETKNNNDNVIVEQKFFIPTRHLESKEITLKYCNLKLNTYLLLYYNISPQKLRSKEGMWHEKSN